MPETGPGAGEGRAGWRHESVLEAEAVAALVTDPGGLYVDATLGLGGHSQALLDRLSPEAKLLGLDLDPEAAREASLRVHPKPGQLFRTVVANFRTLPRVVEGEGFFPLAGVLFDLGVSSMHLESAARGFSFQREGPLDMRLSPENPLTAESIVNRWPAEQLELIFKEYGEEPRARRLAQAIAARRQTRPFETTTELANFIARLAPRSRIHPATRAFQALRIAVNNELENLTRALEALGPLLAQGGRVAVISFHSLEDRIVKNIFSSFVSQGGYRWVLQGRGASWRGPSPAERDRNPRARSAKLRVIEKL